MLRRMSVTDYVTLGNFSCNLCRNKIVRQVTGKIAFCNVVFKVRVISRVSRFGSKSSNHCLKWQATESKNETIEKKRLKNSKTATGLHLSLTANQIIKLSCVKRGEV